jgi:2-hydroxycyclohexanecarboxyl-CoA dehydrogenase
MADSPPPVALVTGATSGIGGAVARRLREDGYSVAGLDIAAPEGLLPEGRGTEDGLFSAFWVTDLTDSEGTSTALERIFEESSPAVLVHCAGWTPFGEFLESTPDVDARILAVNLTGMLNVVRPVLRRMVDAGSGRIVLISSDAARVGVHGEAVYAGAKAAQIAFAKSVAVEVARTRVTVNVVCPGTTDTPLLRRMFSQEQIEKRTRANPMKRIATADDVANAVEFFTRPGSDYITGQVLSVNGGLTRVD